MKTAKATANDKLKAELFSINQLVKFATKGDGKTIVSTYIKEKGYNLKLGTITTGNVLQVMPEKIQFISKKVDGVYTLTDEKRTKFSTWHLLTCIDKLAVTING